MATTTKNAVVTRANNELANELEEIARSYTKNPNITRFSISINKRTGVARTTAVGVDGKTKTTELIGPGLSATMTYLPSDKGARDANIRALRSKGLTQMEIAQRLGVSQSLVAKVLKH